jgi:hypothetical protein
MRILGACGGGGGGSDFVGAPHHFYLSPCLSSCRHLACAHRSPPPPPSLPRDSLDCLSPRIRFPQIVNGGLALPHSVFTVDFDDSAWAVSQGVASPPWPSTPADIETAPSTHVPGARVGPYSVLAAGQLTLGTNLVRFCVSCVQLCGDTTEGR